MSLERLRSLRRLLELLSSADPAIRQQGLSLVEALQDQPLRRALLERLLGQGDVHGATLIGLGRPWARPDPIRSWQVRLRAESVHPRALRPPAHAPAR